MNPDFLRFMLVGGWPDGMVGGLLINLLLAVASFVVGFLVAIPIALLRLRTNAVASGLTCAVELIRATPLLLLVFWCHFTVPLLTGGSANPFYSALFALTLYSIAYQSEIIRAGFAGVPAGEVEAGLALGMTARQASINIVVPQGLCRMLPASFSFAVSLFKDTAVVYVVGVVDLLQAGLIGAERHPGRMLSMYLAVAAGFFVVSVLITLVGKLVERRFALTRPLSI